MNAHTLFDRLRLNKLIIAITFLLLFIVCIFTEHIDTRTLVAFSLDVWEALFSGRIGEYYRVSAENIWGSPEGGACIGYNILQNIPWSIWNLPIWIIHKIRGRIYIGFWDMVYAKSFLWLCVVAITVYARRIISKLSKAGDLDRDPVIATMLLGGSISWLIVIGICGQDEVVYLAFAVAGLYYTIIHRYNTAAVLLAVSAILCPLMIIPILTIILIYEKNVLKIAGWLILVAGINPIVSRLCGSGELYSLSQSMDYDVSASVFDLNVYSEWFLNSSSIRLGAGKISIFLVAIILYYIYLYFSDPVSDTDRAKQAIVSIATVLLTTTCIFWETTHYRYCLYVPFIIVALFVSAKGPYCLNAGIFAYVMQNMTGTLSSMMKLFVNEKSGLSLNMPGFIPEIDILAMVIDSTAVALTIFLLFIVYCGKEESLRSVNIPIRISMLLYYAGWIVSVMCMMIYVYMLRS